MQSIHLFCNTPINDSAIDYHIALSQDIIQLCLTNAELQTEFYCQLVKQTTKLRSGPPVVLNNVRITSCFMLQVFYVASILRCKYFTLQVFYVATDF